jgi:hypothetical protein
LPGLVEPGPAVGFDSALSGLAGLFAAPVVGEVLDAAPVRPVAPAGVAVDVDDAPVVAAEPGDGDGLSAAIARGDAATSADAVSARAKK